MTGSLQCAHTSSIVKLFQEDQKLMIVSHDNVLQIARSPLPISIELLREIVLLYLADAFFELVVTPDLDVHWDPVSPLLHTSFHFRQVTDTILQPILGSPCFQFSSLKEAMKAIIYLCTLDDLQLMKISALQSDPWELLDPDVHFPHPSECESPILWHARAFMMNTLYLRLLEAHMPQLGDQRYAKLWTYVRSVNDTVLSSTVQTPPSILNSVLMPIQNGIFLSKHLVERIFIVQVVCVFCTVYWAAPEHVTGRSAPLAGLVCTLERVSKAVAEHSAELAKMGLQPDQWLPIPQAVLDSVDLPKCWGLLKAQINLPVKGDATRRQKQNGGCMQDDATYQFGLRLRDHLSSVLAPEQKARCLTQGVDDIPLA